jgi:pepF/M3 family oligoendopeptidase
MTTSEATTLPRWDMSGIYPGLATDAFRQGFQSLVEGIDQLGQLFNQHGVGQRPPATLDDATVQSFETVAPAYNQLLDQARTVRSYIYSFISTDSRDTQAQAEWSALQQQLVKLVLLGTRWSAWLGSLDVEALVERSALAGEHAYPLRREKRRSAYLLTPAEEELTAQLSVTGGTAWSNLYRNYVSQIKVPVDVNGEPRKVPVPEAQNLMLVADREVRQEAYEAVMTTMEEHAVPIAAALNCIKGEMNTLSKRRGWPSPLDAALFDNNVDRPTLDAMLEAAREAYPDMRRFMKLKARMLGLPALAWYDRMSPFGHSKRAWAYDEARGFIEEQFGSFSPRLQRLAQRAFGEGWIDAEPRVGKSGGAFCMPVRADESRILTNYEPILYHVTTLAHELGHAYHNVNLASRTALQRATPMTLAETASTFCETLVRHAALRQADAEEQIAILGESVQNSVIYIVVVPARFLFEQAVYERRQQRELSVQELNELTLDAQRQTYGEALDPAQMSPYDWALVPHYYGSNFYNFPYMFGLLFGLGLYASYQQDPEQFKAGYDELLSSTGLGEAAELAARFGIDTRSIDFWRSSIDVIRADINQLEKLVA